MDAETRLWILGASDPEMSAIEAMLKDSGEAYAYALGPDGQRVHPGSAYKATRYSVVVPPPGVTLWNPVENLDAIAQGYQPARDTTIIFVECDLPMHASWRCEAVDHHRPGDPGYGKPPAEFFAASSIGQVTDLLVSAISVTHDDLYHLASHAGVDIILTAAADHCLGAAYRGECPGVDPDELMNWRINSRAKFQGREVSDVLADVERARKILESLDNDDSGVVDCRTILDGIPELPEAACREGVAYLTTVTDRDGRVKEVLGGCTTPDMVQTWMAARKAEGREVYGDPARGFAGAYVQ